jgi:transposase
MHDRDLNAALNLKELAVSFTVTACGAVGFVLIIRPGQSGILKRTYVYRS